MNRTNNLSSRTRERKTLWGLWFGMAICAGALFLLAASSAWAQQQALPGKQESLPESTPAYRKALGAAPKAQLPAEKLKMERESLEATESAPAEASAPGEKGRTSSVKQVVPAPATGVGNRGNAAPNASRIAPGPRPDPRSRILAVRPVPRFHVSIWTDRDRYTEGDPIEIYFRATRDAYVYIFDTDPSGVTRQIFPNYYDRDNYVQASATYAIPDRSYSFVVEGPGGRETLQIVAIPDRGPVYRIYEKFDRGDPYPRRDGGTRMFLQRIESEPEEQRRTDIRISAGARARSLAIQPSARRHMSSASDETSFRVVERQRHGKGKLQVVSDPSDARIYIDGRYTGEKTGETFKLGYGTYEITVEKTGYYSQSQVVTVEQEKTYLRFNLERIGSRRRGR
ncbi:DUF4384 domain-containing protein [Candidatus Sumerlaeota bacterium]|nr:DUF4384 domain-containing protein [Candidatus Sumerlaeota bacterium]